MSFRLTPTNIDDLGWT